MEAHISDTMASSPGPSLARDAQPSIKPFSNHPKYPSKHQKELAGPGQGEEKNVLAAEDGKSKHEVP